MTTHVPNEARKAALDALKQAKLWPKPGATGQMIGMERYSVRIDNVDGDFLYTLQAALQQPDTSEVRVLVEALSPLVEQMLHDGMDNKEDYYGLIKNLMDVLSHPCFCNGGNRAN